MKKLEQYNSNSVVEYHDILFGKNWIRTGGKNRILDIMKTHEFKSGMNVLDIGCGKGGASIELAKAHPIAADGIDLTESFIQQARIEAERNALTDKVHFYHGNILNFEGKKPYDFIFSIDTFLHIKQKRALFDKIGSLLQPQTGKLVFEDYCIGLESNAMREYAEEFDYDLMTVKDYLEIIKSEGFDVVTQDLTDIYMDYSMREYQRTKEYNLSFLESVFEKRIARISNGGHLLVRFCCRLQGKG